MSMSIKKTLAGFGAASLLGLASVGAHAAVIATLTFDSPTGTVSSSASIPVYLTLTLDPSSDPITTDASSHVTSPNPYSPDPNVILNNTYFCSGNFTKPDCGAGAYSFNFNFDPPSFVAPANVNLAPGSVSHWLFGTFVPVGGHAASGTYTFYDAQFDFEATDTGMITDLANTCDPSGATCSFTRTVVPEPATWAMMLVGFGGLGLAMRSRRRPIAAS